LEGNFQKGGQIAGESEAWSAYQNCEFDALAEKGKAVKRVLFRVTHDITQMECMGAELLGWSKKLMWTKNGGKVCGTTYSLNWNGLCRKK